MQELLLGEQSPSPSLSRSSSVSSVLMVSIFHHFQCHLCPSIIIIFVIVVLLPRCHHHPRHHLCHCVIHIILVGPKHPPLRQSRCARGENDAAATDKNPTAGGQRWTFEKDFWQVFAKFHLFLSSRWAERKERIQQHRNETRARSLFLWKKTQRERGEGGNWRGRTSDWKNRFFCDWQQTMFFVGTWHWKEGIDF